MRNTQVEILQATKPLSNGRGRIPSGHLPEFLRMKRAPEQKQIKDRDFKK